MMRLLLTLILTFGVLASASTALADESQFKADLDALTASDHRLAGTDEGRAAGDYLIERLEAIGVDQVVTLEFPMAQTRVGRCEVLIDGKSIPLLPLRPNIVANPTTPAAGVTGPMLYVGDGSLQAITAALETHGQTLGDAATIENTIVVIDYDSFDNWEIAFSLGAAAVVFLGDDDATNTAPLHAGVPGNLLRFYAHADDSGTVGGVDLTQPRTSVTLHSNVAWFPTVGRNIIALIEGTEPITDNNDQAPEAMVLAVPYDSFGNVPQRAAGARAAANLAALLEIAQDFVEAPPKRHTILLFADNQARQHQGARVFYDALMAPADLYDKQAEVHAAESEADMLALSLLEQRRLDLAPLDGDDAETLSALKLLRQMYASQADWSRDNLQFDLQNQRMRWLVEDREARVRKGELPAEEEARRAGIEADVTAVMRRWDDIRRALHNRALHDLVLELQAVAGGEENEDGYRSMALRRAGEIAFERIDQQMREAEQAKPKDQRRSEGELREAIKAAAKQPMRDATIAEAQTFLDGVLEDLIRQTRDRINARLGELAVLMRGDEQRTALREALSLDGKPFWISVHNTLDFGDAGGTWGPVIGDHTAQVFPIQKPAGNADAPGFYVRLLGALRETVGDDAEALGIEPQSLVNPDHAAGYIPGLYFHSGVIAGRHAVYNLGLMTGHDARLRDGHPADTVANLDWAVLRGQALAAGGLMQRFASAPGMSQKRRFSASAQSKLTTWARGKSTGEYAGLKVTGGLSERRPAAGALIAYWPGKFNQTSQAMASLTRALHAPAFEPVAYEFADVNGNFPIVLLDKAVYKEPLTLGALFDGQGAIRAVTSQDSINQKLADAIRTDLFLAKPKVFTYRPTYTIKPEQLKVMRGNADQVFRVQRTLFGQVGSHNAFFIAKQVIDDRTKLFQPMGPVALGALTDDEVSGRGLEASVFEQPPRLAPIGALDLWSLNESRLRRLRARGVTSADLELLHARAGRALESVEADQSLAEREAGLARSHMLSHRVYRPLRKSMDDLVHSVVMLLLLAIPFAFSMERLTIGASSIYGRIAGFVFMFLATFALLYWLHPGFAIASTPIIIFLAFAIILLSAMVIYIVTRKFQTELKAIQGQAGGAHDIEVSKAGAMLAAISMGISTMRRRPTRTFLTATTVVMLTFTILCFASFSTEIGVRAIYEGPVVEGTPESVTLRNLDYSKIQPAIPDLLTGMPGEGGMLAQQWWVVPEGAAAHFAVSTPPDGRSENVNAIMGLDADEFDRWPGLAEALTPAPELDGQPILGPDHLYLPDIVMSLLNIEPGDRVLIHGIPATVRGRINGDTLQRLRRIDGEPVLPVDFRDESNAQLSEGGQDAADDDGLASDVQRDYVYLSADQVAVVSNTLARRLGGDLHILNVYPGQGTSPTDLGRSVAQTVVMPVWAAGDQGVERMLLTRLTSVAGGMRLAVPLLLGGLIIFGTLLGSISDREKEIYTFSALGLSPGHVGVLFFAEATVYAFVGGMGGQLLAQFVALGAAQLTKLGLIDPVSINYSSTNSLFAIGVVMATVIVSAIYPAYRASKSANPGLARAWKLPKPEGDDLKLLFPFTVSAYDITGIVAFLAEHFRRHDDAGLGDFAASNVEIGRDENGELQLRADLALAPFDLGVTQHMSLTAVPSEIPGVDEVEIHSARASGAKGDWVRSNKVFIRGLRRQFLLWRTLGGDVIEQYRMQTLETLGEMDADDIEHTQPRDTKGGA